MTMKKKRLIGLMRPSDAALPVALMLTALTGREELVLSLLIALYAVRLCALSTADGLRAAFSCQPSMRYVQGSALLALGSQLFGAVVAALLSRVVRLSALSPCLITCALLLNIEHVFYEYLYALGDSQSAALYRSLTVLLTATGLLLCESPDSPIRLSVTSGLSAAVGLTLCLSLGGRLRPRFDAMILRLAPSSMLQSALYPVLTLALGALLSLSPKSVAPLCAGLALYELCRTPFRRSPLEAAPLRHALVLTCGISLLLGLAALFSGVAAPKAVSIACGAVMLAALCAYVLFGSLTGKEAETL